MRALSYLINGNWLFGTARNVGKDLLSKSVFTRIRFTLR